MTRAMIGCLGLGLVALTFLALPSNGVISRTVTKKQASQLTKECPTPGELVHLSSYPILYQGPYANTQSHYELRPKYKVQITDDDGSTYTDLFGPMSPVALFAVRGDKLFQLGGNLGPVADNFNHFAEAFAHAVKRRKMASADFCFDATDNDAFIMGNLREAELYCASQITWLPAVYPVIAVPNDYYENSLLNDHMTTVPWEHKVSKIFWRGGLTGTLNMYKGKHDDPFFNLPRVMAYQVAQKYASMFDFGFNHIDEQLTVRYMGGKKNKDQADLIGGIKLSQHSDFSVELPRFRYLLNVDGIVVAWRLRDLLRSGSVVLHFVGTSAEFFFRDLKPWVHYVPVHDIEEVPTLYEKLEADPDLARSIAAAGKAFADERLTVEGQDCYLEQFLEFIGNRTDYRLADEAALRSMGFAEIDVKVAALHFLQRQQSHSET